MKRLLLSLLSAALLATVPAGCAREDSADGPSPRGGEAPIAPFLSLVPDGDGFVNVPLARVTEKALFVDVPNEGAPTVQLLALRDGAGRARIAFNTCQACSPSPRAFFAQDASGRLVCQNCGNTFAPEAVGARTGGCNPAFVPGVTETDDALRVPAAALDAARGAFADWAGPRG